MTYQEYNANNQQNENTCTLTDKSIPFVLDKKNGFWFIKHTHASGHGGQKINHGNSKSQLHFNINKFFNDFRISNKIRNTFVKIFGKKNITHDQSTAIYENQETRFASKNDIKVINHLRQLLLTLLKETPKESQTGDNENNNKPKIFSKKDKKHQKFYKNNIDYTEFDNI